MECRESHNEILFKIEPLIANVDKMIEKSEKDMINLRELALSFTEYFHMIESIKEEIKAQSPPEAVKRSTIVAKPGTERSKTPTRPPASKKEVKKEASPEKSKAATVKKEVPARSKTPVPVKTTANPLSKSTRNNPSTGSIPILKAKEVASTNKDKNPLSKSAVNILKVNKAEHPKTEKNTKDKTLVNSVSVSKNLDENAHTAKKASIKKFPAPAEKEEIKAVRKISKKVEDIEPKESNIARKKESVEVPEKRDMTPTPAARRTKELDISVSDLAAEPKDEKKVSVFNKDTSKVAKERASMAKRASVEEKSKAENNKRVSNLNNSSSNGNLTLNANNSVKSLTNTTTTPKTRDSLPIAIPAEVIIEPIQVDNKAKIVEFVNNKISAKWLNQGNNTAEALHLAILTDFLSFKTKIIISVGIKSIFATNIHIKLAKEQVDIIEKDIKEKEALLEKYMKVLYIC